MKEGRDAEAQYSELANALQEIGAGWILEEVDEIAVEGKLVPYSDLPSEDRYASRVRLADERQKGFLVGSLRPSDLVGQPYTWSERLELLVEAAERVVLATTEAISFLNRFSESHGIQAIAIQNPALPGEEPVGVEGRQLLRRDVPASEALAQLRSLLRDALE